MIKAAALSKNGVRIRLTQERWNHILITHLEITAEDLKNVLNVISKPDIILKGDDDELLAVKRSKRKIWFGVPYKEVNRTDGFILTAYVTSDLGWLLKKEVIWIKE